MTNEERTKLLECHEAVMVLKRALMEVPPGSPPDTQPLIADLRTVVQAYKRASWSTRAMIYLIPTLALLGASYQTIRGWFS